MESSRSQFLDSLDKIITSVIKQTEGSIKERATVDSYSNQYCLKAKNNKSFVPAIEIN
jgi:hypothetical protein